jgi:hypothetical protein
MIDEPDLSDEALGKLCSELRSYDVPKWTQKEAADAIDALRAKVVGLRKTVDAAAKLERIVDFLGYDEERLDALITELSR